MRLIILGGGWLFGLYAGSKLGVPVPLLASLVPAALVATFLLRRSWRGVLLGLLIAAALAGALRFQLHEDAAGRETLALNNGAGRVEIEGVVTSYPELRGSAIQFNLSAQQFRVDGEWRDVSGRVRVTARSPADLVGIRDPPNYRQGDLLRIAGEMESPQRFGDFDFPNFLAQQGVRSVMDFPRVTFLEGGQGPLMDRVLFSVRSRLAESLDLAIPGPNNGVAQAVALGIRQGIPGDLSEAFNESGTTHLLAVSGLHVAIVMGLALAVSRRLFWKPRLLMYLAPLIAVWLYALLAGLAPSAERAAIMGSFYLAALYFGRQRHGIEALLLAALLITAINPLALWQVSFQMSFLAMSGIVLVAPPLLEYVAGHGSRESGVIGSVVRTVVATTAMGIAATLMTWPAVAFYFDRVSIVGVPATVLALPLLPVVLVTSLLTGLVGLFSAPAALAIGWFAWLSLEYVIWVVQLFAAIPLAAIRLEDAGQPLALAYYAVIGAVLLALRSSASLRTYFSSCLPRPSFLVPRVPAIRAFPLVALSLAALTALAWWSAVPQPRGLLEVTILDVGQGGAILLRTPSRVTVLVDGGPNPQALNRALGPQFSYWSRRIDLVVATQPDQDHIGGLADVLARYEVGAVLQPVTEANTAAFKAWQEAVRRHGVPLLQAEAGQQVNLGDGVMLEVLHPPARPLSGTRSDIDNNSVVLRVVYGDVSFLLTGDLFALGETYLVERDANLASTVLKVGHHGSDTSTTQAFLQAVNPSAAVISVADDNPFGHPRQSTLDSIAAFVPEEGLFLTSRHGSIRFTSDGHRLWVDTER